jgi:hypothetical protein
LWAEDEEDARGAAGVELGEEGGEEGAGGDVETGCAGGKGQPYAGEKERRNEKGGLKGSSRMRSSGFANKAFKILARLVCPLLRVMSGKSRNVSISSSFAVLSIDASSCPVAVLRCSRTVSLSSSRIEKYRAEKSSNSPPPLRRVLNETNFMISCTVGFLGPPSAAGA